MKDEIESDSWNILDVRPEYEFNRVQIKDATHIPLFSCSHDYSKNPEILLKSIINFMMLGLYTGTQHTELNHNFMYKVHG